VNLVDPALKRRYQRYVWLQAHPTDTVALRRSRADPTAEGRDRPASVVVRPPSPVRMDRHNTAMVTFRDPARQAAHLASRAGRFPNGVGLPSRTQQGGWQSLPGDRDARFRQGMWSPVDMANRGYTNPAPQQVRRRQEPRLGNQPFRPRDGNNRNPPTGPRANNQACQQRAGQPTQQGNGQG